MRFNITSRTISTWYCLLCEHYRNDLYNSASADALALDTDAVGGGCRRDDFLTRRRYPAERGALVVRDVEARDGRISRLDGMVFTASGVRGGIAGIEGGRGYDGRGAGRGETNHPPLRRIVGRGGVR